MCQSSATGIKPFNFPIAESEFPLPSWQPLPLATADRLQVTLGEICVCGFPPLR